MIKQKKILINFILWCLGLFLICCVGISNVFALDNNNAIQFYDNNGSSLTSVSTNYIQQTDESNAIFTTTANSYGGAVMIQSTIPLVQGHIYTMFLNVGAYSNGGYTELSTKNCVGLGGSYANAINSYVNCNITPKYSQKSGVTTDKGRGLYFTFIADTNGAYILLPYTTQLTCTNCQQYSFGFTISDGGDTTGLTQTEVNNLISNQTTIIENQITGMQNSITGAVDSMGGSITNSIENNLNSCHTSQNLINANLLNGVVGIEVKDNGEKIKLPLNETPNTNGVMNTTKKLKELAPDLQLGDKVVLMGYTTSGNNKFIYLQGGNVLWYFNQITQPLTVTQAMLDGNVYLYRNNTSANETSQVVITKLGIYKYEYITGGGASDNWEPYGEVCKNKLDEQNETSKGILGKLGDLFNLFNDDDIGDSADDGADFITGFNTNTFGLTSIITAPLNLIQSLTSKTCTPLHLPLPYLDNKYLDLPCMSTLYSEYFGDFYTLYQTITYGAIAYWVCVLDF